MTKEGPVWGFTVLIDGPTGKDVRKAAKRLAALLEGSGLAGVIVDGWALDSFSEDESLEIAFGNRDRKDADSRLREGDIRKGGLNSGPIPPRPLDRPPPQRPPALRERGARGE